MLSGPLVTKAWRVLKLRAEETASRYGGISSGGQSTRGRPQAWGLGMGLTTPHRKIFLLQNFTKGLGLGWTWLWIGTSGGLL
jgi:hypothetical protein